MNTRRTPAQRQAMYCAIHGKHGDHRTEVCGREEAVAAYTEADGEAQVAV